MAQQKILPLTSLRFFAAMYVVLYHCTDHVFLHARDLSTLHGSMLDMGYVSVSFFFTLSGYILAVSYLRTDRSKQEFWWARFARVYPLFLLTLLLDTPQYIAGVAKTIGMRAALHLTAVRIAENLAMLQAWNPKFRAMDGPNWSLAAEAFFYLLFPFLIAVVARLTLSWLVMAAVLTYAAGMTGVLISLHSHLQPDVIKFNPALHLHAFVIGMLLGAFRLKTRMKPQFAPFLILIATLGFATVAAYYSKIPMLLIHDGLLVPAFACGILAFHSENKTLDYLFSLSWLVILGDASYALYLIHIPLWHVVYHLRLDHSPIAYAAYLLSVVLLSVVSFYFIETPMRRAITRWRRAAKVAVSPVLPVLSGRLPAPATSNQPVPAP